MLSILFTGCTQRVACPAFQSAYIYDKDELRKRFSYFQEDSTPKVLTASKNKYLIAEPMSYRRKVRAMQTVPMKPVYVAVPDSFKIEEDIMMDEDGVVPGAELDMAARSVIDSIYIVDVPQDTLEEAVDSVYVISKDREVRMLKYDFPDSLILDEATGEYVAETPRYTVTEVRFNVEQDNYMWYLRDYLVLPDVRLASINQGSEPEKAEEKKEKKKKKGFFKNLFGKKKDEVDSANLPPPPPKKEFDFVDEDEQLKPKSSAPEPQEEERKGILSRKRKEQAVTTDEDQVAEEKPARKKKEKKKRKKADKADKAVPPPAEQKPEDADEDDGF